MATLVTPSLIYLWRRRTFYLGTLAEPLKFSPAVPILVVSLDQPLRIGLPHTELQCQSALLPAGLNVTIDAGVARIANCYLDPLGEDYVQLSRRMVPGGQGVYWQLDDEANCARAFTELYACSAPPVEVYAFLDALMAYPEHTESGQCLPDSRILRTIELIQARIGENLSVEILAAQVGLSVPRLVQLFKQSVGIPIRRYRQWHRLFVTALGVAGGHSLTDAAMAAGFTDSAHFSHTFRSLIGMKPSDLLSHSSGMRLFAG